MKKLFELKQMHAEAIRKSEAILSVAERENRPLTSAEAELSDIRIAQVNDLGVQIEKERYRNTIHGSIGKFGFFGNNDRELPELPSVGERNPLGARGLQAALAFASPSEVENVRQFAKYLGGDMSAAADLTPSGAGGFFIPSLVAGVVARNYYAYTPVRNAATVWPTDGGEPTTWPVISDQDVAVIIAPAGLTGADATISGNAPPTAITGPLLGAHKFSSKPVAVPREIVTDANLNVLEEMLSALLARIARTQNLKYTKGTGVGEPTGFMLNATPYSAGSVPLSLDVALDLAYSVPAMYRPTGVYMASDLTIKYLRKLKTGIAGDQRALWKDAFEEGNASLGTPARLHGYDIVVNNDMDSVNPDGTFTGLNPLAFGAFDRFVIREAERGKPFLYRFDVPAIDSSAVIAFNRSDSQLLVPSAISKLTN